MNKNRNCKSSNFSWKSESWNNVVAQAKYKTQLYEGSAIGNYRENLLIMPTGTRLKLNSQYGIDTHKGEVVWSTHKSNCDNEEFDVLYEGPATEITTKADYHDASEVHTYLVESDKKVFALKKLKRAFACDILVIQTEHPQLLILTNEIYFSRFPTKKISPYNTDLLAYVNTKFVYIENFLMSSTTSLYANLVIKQCNLERKLLLQKLAISTYSLIEFAFTI